VGLAAIRLSGVAIAIFVGVSLIHAEVDRRTVYTILAKPISRAEFLLGKFLGLVMTIWLQVTVLVAFFTAVSLLTGAPVTLTHAAAILLICVELTLMVAVATFFSAFTTPMLASFFSIGVWAVGCLTRNLRDLGAVSEVGSVRLATVWLHRVLPDMASFNLSIEAAHGLPIAAFDVWLPLVYGIGYAAIVLLGAMMIFERRDFR
jgi:ABC-type transport system involved in multi-copper enzyme maturation permease subunit